MAEAERWAAGLGNPAYAIDDDTAIKVVDGAVEVVSEGHWKLFDSSLTLRRRRAARTRRRSRAASARHHSCVSATPSCADATSARRRPSRRQSSVKPRGAASVCATKSTPRAMPCSSSR